MNGCVLPLGRSGIASPWIAVVRKMRLPHTIGDECPRPGIGVFHATFLAVLHSVGRFLSSATPELCGPRHCGQLTVVGASTESSTSGVRTMTTGSSFLISPQYHSPDIIWT